MKLLKHVALAILDRRDPQPPQPLAQDTVKVGVLHSLSGTMAISETSLRDVLLFTFDEINAKGGVHGQEDRARRRRWRLELAALRREGQAAPRAGQGRRHLRLLDLGQPQVGAAGLREEQRAALLPRAVRRRRDVPEHLLHRRSREPAGHARGRLHARARQEEVLPARQRLRLSADHQPRAARVSPEQRRAARKHRRRLQEGRVRQDHLRRQVHAVRPHRLPADRRGDQAVRRRRQSLRHQHAERRHQRSVLQGIRRRRPDRGDLPGRELLDLRRRIPRPARPSSSSASSVAGPTSSRSSRPRTRSSSPTSRHG